MEKCLKKGGKIPLYSKTSSFCRIRLSYNNAYHLKVWSSKSFSKTRFLKSFYYKNWYEYKIEATFFLSQTFLGFQSTYKCFMNHRTAGTWKKCKLLTNKSKATRLEDFIFVPELFVFVISVHALINDMCASHCTVLYKVIR